MCNATKRMILLRHAEAQPELVTSKIKDYNKPITEHGRKTTAQVSEKLAQSAWLDDQEVAILASGTHTITTITATITTTITTTVL